MKEDEIEEDDADLKNDEWLKANYVQLVQEYPRQWIAVIDQKIIASGAMRAAVITAAKEAAGGRSFSLYFIEPTALPL